METKPVKSICFSVQLLYPSSSVRPFHDVNDGAAMDLPETDSNSRARLQEDEEENEEDDWRICKH